MLSCSVVSNSVTLCDPVVHQPPLSMGFSRQEYWSGLPFPTVGLRYVGAILILNHYCLLSTY